MDNLFNEQMTSGEARDKFFCAAEDKTKEELEKLKKDYFAVLPAILKRERELANKGWIFNY